MFSSMLAAEGAASLVAVAVPLGLLKENKKLEKQLNLGVNTEMEKDIGMDNSFELFQFQSGDLPAALEHLLSQKWCLTERELFQLFSIVRNVEKEQALCAREGADYDAYVKMSRAAASQVVDYKALAWLSDKRLADPVVKQKLLPNG